MRASLQRPVARAVTNVPETAAADVLYISASFSRSSLPAEGWPNIRKGNRVTRQVAVLAACPDNYMV